MNPYQDNTEARAKAIAMYKKGIPIKIIMSKIDISKWGLYLWLQGTETKPDRRGYKLDIDKAIELKKQGMTRNEVAKVVNCSASYVGIVLNKQGISFRLKLGDIKKCAKCGELKPFTPEFFHRGGAGDGGLRYHCKKCAIEYTKKYYRRKKEKQ